MEGPAPCGLGSKASPPRPARSQAVNALPTTMLGVADLASLGKPGSPEFLASYEVAHRNKRTPDPTLFKSVVTRYLKSKAFTERRARTQADYLKQIAKIERAFGDLPLAALDDPRVTRDFLDWRDSMTSPRQADYAWTVLMRIISWAREGGETTYRPPERVERLYHADRAEKIWTEQHVAAFRTAAPETLQRALMLALETGQRQGDLYQRS